MQIKNIGIVGGDFRNLNLYELLIGDGYSVCTFGLADTDCANMEVAVKNADLVMGAIPFSNDGKSLNTPLFADTILVTDFFKELKKKSILVAGKIDENVYEISRQYDIKTVDILERVDFCVLNAIPTAEGIIQLMIKETPYTLNSSNVIVLGFGRVGKVVCHMLSGMGINLHVASKMFDENAYCRAYGIKNIKLEDLKKHIGDMNVIINTIPALILNEDILNFVSKKSLIIDISSKPGGVDFDKAKGLGIKTIWALSIPGKIAPETSAKIIKDTILNIMHEMEV